LSNMLIIHQTNRAQLKLDHNDMGITRQHNLVYESGGVMDFISVTDRTESMSSITQEKAEIAAHVPELFCLKKFICSDAEVISTGKVAMFFFKNMSIPAKY